MRPTPAEVWAATPAVTMRPAVACVALGEPNAAARLADARGDRLAWAEPYRHGVLDEIAVALGDHLRAKEVAPAPLSPNGVTTQASAHRTGPPTVPALRAMSPVVTWVNRNALSMTPMTTKAMP